MDVRELRIGNLVKYGVHNVPIKSINVSYDNEATVYVKLNEKLNHYCLSINEIEPIPITEEWLLRFGFTKISQHTDGFYLNVNGCKIAGLKLDGESVKLWLNMFGTSIVNDIIYIHQLQNLYFALTGKELTYE